MRILVLLAACLALLACEQQASQSSQQRDVSTGACSDDISRLCAGVQPGEGRIDRCLRDRAADLNADCKVYLKIE